MEKLKNEKVKHNLFGEGVITEEKESYITIKFKSIKDVKNFKYPDSFEKVMSFLNNDLQQVASSQINTEKGRKQIIENIKKVEYQKIDDERRRDRAVKLKKKKVAVKTK